jgi:hypothetical protein
MCRGQGGWVLAASASWVKDEAESGILVVVLVVMLSASATRGAICASKSARGSVGMLRREKGLMALLMLRLHLKDDVRLELWRWARRFLDRCRGNRDK